jgi:hypothetical protein
MYNFDKGEYKIYVYNDGKLIDELKRKFKGDDRMLSHLKCINQDTYYFRIKNGIFVGHNHEEYKHYDTKNTIMVDGRTLVCMGIVPEELFKM